MKTADTVHRTHTGIRYGLYSIAIFTVFTMMLPQAAHADAKVNLHTFCAQSFHSKNVYVRYDQKRRAWKCTKFVTRMGFNTTYNDPVKSFWIDPAQVCRRQFRTDWSHANARGIYCREETRVKICNSTRNELWVAVAHFAGRRAGWRNVGWWGIQPRGCIDHRLPGSYKGDIYLYGVDKRGREWQGATGFCTRKLASFSLDQSDTSRCSGGDFQRKNYFRFPVRARVSSYNFHE